eukprot:PhM_4_TR6317/c0_g1_i1/m.48323
MSSSRNDRDDMTSVRHCPAAATTTHRQCNWCHYTLCEMCLDAWMNDNVVWRKTANSAATLVSASAKRPRYECMWCNSGHLEEVSHDDDDDDDREDKRDMRLECLAMNPFRWLRPPKSESVFSRLLLWPSASSDPQQQKKKSTSNSASATPPQKLATYVRGEVICGRRNNNSHASTTGSYTILVKERSPLRILFCTSAPMSRLYKTIIVVLRRRACSVSRRERGGTHNGSTTTTNVVEEVPAQWRKDDSCAVPEESMIFELQLDVPSFASTEEITFYLEQRQQQHQQQQQLVSVVPCAVVAPHPTSVPIWRDVLQRSAIAEKLGGVYYLPPETPKEPEVESADARDLEELLATYQTSGLAHSWLNSLQNGRNLLLTGYGCKRDLLDLLSTALQVVNHTTSDNFSIVSLCEEDFFENTDDDTRCFWIPRNAQSVVVEAIERHLGIQSSESANNANSSNNNNNTMDATTTAQNDVPAMMGAAIQQYFLQDNNLLRLTQTMTTTTTPFSPLDFTTDVDTVRGHIHAQLLEQQQQQIQQQQQVLRNDSSTEDICPKDYHVDIRYVCCRQNIGSKNRVKKKRRLFLFLSDLDRLLKLRGFDKIFSRLCALPGVTVAASCQSSSSLQVLNSVSSSWESVHCPTFVPLTRASGDDAVIDFSSVTVVSGEQRASSNVVAKTTTKFDILKAFSMQHKKFLVELLDLYLTKGSSSNNNNNRGIALNGLKDDLMKRGFFAPERYLTFVSTELITHSLMKENKGNIVFEDAAGMLAVLKQSVGC